MIAIGCDHAGFDLKPHVIQVLEELGLPYLDLGTDSRDSVDYPVYGARRQGGGGWPVRKGHRAVRHRRGISMVVSKVRVSAAPAAAIAIPRP